MKCNIFRIACQILTPYRFSKQNLTFHSKLKGKITASFFLTMLCRKAGSSEEINHKSRLRITGQAITCTLPWFLVPNGCTYIRLPQEYMPKMFGGRKGQAGVGDKEHVPEVIIDIVTANINWCTIDLHLRAWIHYASSSSQYFNAWKANIVSFLKNLIPGLSKTKLRDMDNNLRQIFPHNLSIGLTTQKEGKFIL